MISYDSVSEAVNGLKKSQDDRFDINDFEIVEVYRFEGNSDPADEAIVYAIESVTGVKGVLVSGYGISAEGMSAEMAKKLRMQKR